MTKRCFAIGDSHGHSNALTGLLALLEKDAGLSENDLLIFMGDYVDRGPDDEGVLRMVMELTRNRPNTIALLGNHDSWRTASTVGADVHLWLRGLPEYFRWQKYFFSHAPVFKTPGPEMLENLPKELWGGFETFEQAINGNYDFINAFAEFSAEELLHEAGIIGVCGHIHHAQAVIYPNYIGIDTGAGFGGKLSAIELPSHKIYSVSEAGKKK